MSRTLSVCAACQESWPAVLLDSGGQCPDCINPQPSREEEPMNKITTIIRTSAKAAVAAVTPIVTAAVVDIFAELSTLATGGVAAAATAVTVWLTRNGPKVAS